VFLTSTPFCMMPVTKLNGTAIADGRSGPIYAGCSTHGVATVGIDIEKQIVEGAQRRMSARHA